MLKTLGVAALMLALCCPALAGEVHTTGAPTPPPPSQPATAAPEATDEEHAGEMPNVLTRAALDLLALLPSLL